MKNISAWAIRNPRGPAVLFAVLTFTGIISFIRLPINLGPDISFPLIEVRVAQPGAAPPELETQILTRIEGAVANLGDVKNITSVAYDGTALAIIEFRVGTPVDRAMNDVRDAVAHVRSSLPEGIDEPRVTRVDIEGGAMAYFGVATTAMTQEQLSWFVDNTLSRRLLAVAGVAQVVRGGGVSREIRIELDPARMQALGITAVEVNRQLRSLNLDAGGGRAQVGGGEQGIRVLGSAASAERLGETQIALADGRTVRLSDLATVDDGVAEIRSIARLDGRPATTIGVFRAKGYSEVSTLDAAEAEIAKIVAENPDIAIDRVFTTVESAKRTYRSAIESLIEGATLAVIVVFVFLREWRATFISALAIPLSAIPTFLFMDLMGFTLNQVSLLALSLVAGVLVDDAIVEIENIVRHMRMGKSGYQASLDAADEIGLAVVATSATIIAVFVPVSFMGGITGQYFRQFGLTVAAAVFFSLVVARLITPVLCAFLLRNDSSLLQHRDGPFMHRYLRLLEWSVDHRWKTLAAGIVFFALSILGLTLIPKSFTPDADFSSPQVKIELPPGVRIEDTAAVSAQAAAILRQEPEVLHIIENIGVDDFGEVRSASIYVSLVEPEDRDESQSEWEQRVLPKLQVIPDARILFLSQAATGLGRDITLYVTGENPPDVERAAYQLVEEMRGVAELRDPGVNGDLQRPEIQIRPRLDLAADLGVTVADISQTIRIATIGDIPQNNAKFSVADRQIPIRVSLPEGARRAIETIENLPVPTANGSTVPLQSVADISFGTGPSRIRRYNQVRRLAVEADLNGAELGPAIQKIYALPTAKNPPPGVKIVEVGSAELMSELFSNFGLAIGAGVLMVFAVLVLLFARVFQPITILSALPLSVGGAVAALAITGYPFSLPTVIGILMLMGIVGKNSILLVDFAIEEMRAGQDRRHALIEAGHKRARPIVMTTIAMIAGMLPVATGIVGDTEFRAPMAVAVIGGLVTSTALTLVMVPALFTLIDDLERWIGPRATRLLAGDTGGGALSADNPRDRA